MMFDRKLRKWFSSHRSAQTTICKCEICGQFYKPTLGHECNIHDDKNRGEQK